MAWLVREYYTWRYRNELDRLLAMPRGARFLYLQQRGYTLVTDEECYQVYQHGEGEMLAEMRFRYKKPTSQAPV